MDVPSAVTEVLDEEAVEASVALGGSDTLFVTPTRTIVYRSEGLLSDEAVEEYTHDVDRIGVSEGRRKATITLAGSLGEEQTLSVPAGTVDDALEPMLAGVLRENNVIEGDETVIHLYRLSELSVVLTDTRLIKHVGASVWDNEYETAPYGDVTALTTEEGDVSTQIVLEVDGRPQRIKAPTSTAKQLREHLEIVLRDYHGIGDTTDLNAALSSDGEDTDTAEATVEEGAAEDVDALAATISEVTEAPDEDTAAGSQRLGGAGFEPPDEAEPAVARELEELRTAIEDQTEVLNQQQELLEQLIDELRRGR